MRNILAIGACLIVASGCSAIQSVPQVQVFEEGFNTVTSRLPGEMRDASVYAANKRNRLDEFRRKTWGTTACGDICTGSEELQWHNRAMYSDQTMITFEKGYCVKMCDVQEVVESE